jgi:transcriptional regulator with XRE-family HTH domain
MLRLKEVRKESNISQQKLADYLNVARSTVAMWEIGGAEPDLTTIRRIADYFNVSMDYLLGRSDIRSPTAPERDITDDDIKFALYGEIGEVTDKQFDEVKRLIQLQRERPL